MSTPSPGKIRRYSMDTLWHQSVPVSGYLYVTRVNLCIKCTEQQEVLAAMRNKFRTRTGSFSHLHLHISSKLTHISHTQLIGQASRLHELHFTGFMPARSIGVG